MVCRIITTSFFFSNCTSKVTSKASRGICFFKAPWGQSLLSEVCQHQNAQDQPDTTNAVTAHLLSWLASLPTRVAQKCYTAMTSAVPGTFTSAHSHSTGMNLVCLLTDLPPDFSFDWQHMFLCHSFINNILGLTFWESMPACLYKCVQRFSLGVFCGFGFVFSFVLVFYLFSCFFEFTKYIL